MNQEHLIHTGVDLHIHTLVSDGFHTPPEMLLAAAAAGLRTVSITDHDAIGAYRHWPDLFTQAHALGLSLTTGIELDTEYRGVEVHLLGYGFDWQHPALNEHLGRVQEQRRLRIGEQIRVVNQVMNKELVSVRDVFLETRDTVMKPHLIRPLLESGACGDSYGAVQDWFRAHVHSDIEVEKLSMPHAIDLIHQAGGRAVLAHPGFIKGLPETGLDAALGEILDELAGWGVDGVEVVYNYQDAHRAAKDPQQEAERAGRLVSLVRALAEERNLLMTRGSDAHHRDDLKPFAEKSFV